MASISKQPHGYRSLQFKSPTDGKRKTVRLGRTTQKDAQSIKGHIEAILSATRSKTSIADEEARWLAEIPDELADKLAAVGIGRARQAATLAAFCESYLAGRTDLKASTRIAYGTARDRIVSFFGADRPLRDITEGDADSFAVHLRGKFAQATMGRTIRVAKQLFRAARRRKLIHENPFADVKDPPQTNESRKAFITLDDTARVLKACPDAEYRLIVALSRFGGLRCPSETLALKWGDVDVEKNRIRVTSPKTEHHPGQAERWIPLFPELRPLLAEVFERAEPGSEYVIAKYRDVKKNFRTRFLRIIRRAGLTPWPKPFHNLRASRETELAAVYPLHVVTAWLGNSALIAQKHYLKVRDEDFERAAQESAAKSAAPALQKALQQPAATERNPSQDNQKSPEKPGFLRELATCCESTRNVLVGLQGLEP
jgi:integrase